MIAHAQHTLDLIRSHPKLVGVDDFEIAFQCFNEKREAFSKGKSTGIQTAQANWLSLRILYRKAVGRSSITTLGNRSAQLLIDNAFLSAEFSSPDPYFRFPIWKKTQARPVVEELPLQLPAREVGELPKAFLESLSETYGSGNVTVWLYRKQEKQEKAYQGTFFTRNIQFGDYRESKAQSLPFNDAGKRLQNLSALSADLRNAEPCTSERKLRNVLLGPSVMVEITRALGDRVCHSSGNIERRVFPHEILGSELMAPCFSFLDDGTYAQGWKNAPFDLEGCPTQKTTVIEKGVFKSQLHDSRSSATQNRLSTGNFNRLRSEEWADIRPSHFYMREGTHTLSDLIGHAKEGFYFPVLENFEAKPFGESTLLNLALSGWEISKTGNWIPLKGVKVETDLRSLLMRGVLVGSDLEFFGDFGAASTLFEEIPKRT